MIRGSSASGGAAASGGFGFQANIGAIAGIHTLRGIPVQWTDGLVGEAPCAISFETSGPGDDLSLELADGSIVEIQVKKGLMADRRFWSAVDALCEGVHCNRCDYGILIVCPNSSVPVRRGYALALERIGAGRNDGASSEQETMASHLMAKGYDAETICARLRIRTVSAVEDAGDAIAAARGQLGHLCAEELQVRAAWNALCQDSLSAMGNRSRRTVSSLLAHLRATGIDIEDTVKDSPVAISDVLLRWTMSRTEHFEVLGIPRPLPTDQAWLALTAVVRDARIERQLSVERALADYHALGEKKSRTDDNVIDARTIGTFRKLCVVVGGPGSGKSLLLSVLAREFAKDSCVSIRVRLCDLATRMQETGCGVEEGLMQLGIDGTGVSREQLCAASLSDLVLLCDGLDECGERQLDIASGLKDISVAHPSYRIVVTTRPIGYSTSQLLDWRHYEVAPLAQADTATHLETLCRSAMDDDGAEGTDELLPRIRTYLEEGTASKLLARSPLLLAFGAALFLNWGDPSKSKLELYQRIFGLIDGASAGRRSAEPPARAIRNRVLNELGWLITAGPLRAAEEIERQCARTMEQALDVTYLRALTEVEASVGYWEEKGLIERLRHPGIELIAFVHKTCGEFAAAQHLSVVGAEEAREAMETVLSDPDWDEILDFAAGTPLASMLAELLVEKFEAVDPDESALNRLFRVLLRPEVSLSPSERESLLGRVSSLAQSEDRQKAYRIGLCLTEHDMSRMLETERMASALVSAPMEWSRLVGWAILACHFSASVPRSALEDALAHFMERSSTEDFFVLRDSRLPFGPFPDRGIFENFVLGAVTALLPDQEAEYQDRLIADVWKSQRGATMGFVSRFEALLRNLGREDASNPSFRSTRFWEALDFSVPTRFGAAYAAVLTEVVPPAFVRDDAGPPPETGLKCLAAFFDLAGIRHVPGNDVYVWLSDDTRLDAVHTLLRAAAHVYELPAERLAAEARHAIEFGESLCGDWKSKRLLDLLPNVDVGEVDWSRANRIIIDIELVEGLIHHPSQWVQRLAALVINERLHGAARRSVCERVLASGTGDALHWAAALTGELADGCDLLIIRLGGRDAVGLHHLFENLKIRGCAIKPSHLTVLEKALVNRNAKTAVSAARWCQDAVSSGDTWLVELLRSASSHWLEHEEPYPESGGNHPR
ncbi:MAG: NACHT domain-containing protein [Gammaproteobacteria bacterium]|nr:NACHT domain-containing protein [Gammaproteobacteria bacterium]